MRLREYGLCIFFMAFLASTGWNAEGDDPWEPIRFLLGEWKGEGERFGRKSRVGHCYEFILNDKFIHSRTKAVFEPEKGKDVGEVHEDWGIFSYDPARGMIVYRQFLSEGYVNTCVMEKAGEGRLQLTTESTEGAGGMRARLKIDIENKNGYKMTLELASPGKDFFVCQRIHMKRSAK